MPWEVHRENVLLALMPDHGVVPRVDKGRLDDTGGRNNGAVTIVSDLEEGHAGGADDLQVISVVRRTAPARRKGHIVDLTSETPPRASSATAPLSPAPDVIALGALPPSTGPARTPKCSVCLGETMSRPTATVCGHIYCEACIRLALRQTGTCPTCRRKLKGKDIHRIYL